MCPVPSEARRGHHIPLELELQLVANHYMGPSLQTLPSFLVHHKARSESGHSYSFRTSYPFRKLQGLNQLSLIQFKDTETLCDDTVSMEACHECLVFRKAIIK